jgi:hypothetical protein
MKVLQLVDWMDKGLTMSVVDVDVTEDLLNDEAYVFKHKRKILADLSTVVVSVREIGSAFVLGFVPSEGVFVVVPWWYFREVES